MSYSFHEGRLLEVFSQFGMIRIDGMKGDEDSLVDVVLNIPKTHLLKNISQITEAFLAMQSISPIDAINYLSYVTGTLFDLVSHPDPDVRITADEGINQIVKLADIQMVQHVICEVFLEIKRSLHARSLSSALRKFSAFIDRISPKKRRIYAVNILPALSALIEREEEMVWDCLAETIEPIANFIFPHTSQQELITLLLKGLLEKVECAKNYIRRSAAAVLASSVVYSRLPHELSYLLIQHLIGRVFELKKRLLSCVETAPIAAMGLQGCLWSLRNLAALYSQIPSPALVNGCTKLSGRPRPSIYLSAPLIAMASGTADFADWSLESLEFFWWSVVRLICLQLACRNYQSMPSGASASSGVMVCTAALQCLFEVLSYTPVGSPPTELPSGFYEALNTFFSIKKSSSVSSALHLDDYDSSVDASDTDDGSSVTSQSRMPSASGIVEVGNEKISIVKRNLLPLQPLAIETEMEANDLQVLQVVTNERNAECGDENEIDAFTTTRNCLGLFVHRFGLLLGTDISARTSTQSLAVACLAKMSLILPSEVFFEPLETASRVPDSPEKKDISGVQVALHLTRHSDPQVRGNACLLVGNLLRSAVAWALVEPTTSRLDAHHQMQICLLVNSLDDRLASEKSGVTYRLALKALRCCANALLHLPALVTDDGKDTGMPTTNAASLRLLRCLSARLIDCARHPYRLVRLETVFIIAELDWDQLEHLERAWFGHRMNGAFRRIVEATPLAIVAWNECLRLFADADHSLGREAFKALLVLANRTPSNDLQDISMGRAGLELFGSVDARVLKNSAMTGQNAVACDLPVYRCNCTSIISGFSDELCSVAKDLSVDVRFSAPPLPSNKSTNTKKSQWRRAQQHSRGMHRLFRELVDCLLELSPVCESSETRSMMHSIVYGLSQLLGHTPITSHSLLWYSSPPSLSDALPADAELDVTDISPALLAVQRNQRRPKTALLLWHCISQLQISPLALSDLSLQTEMLCLASGCALRWGVASLLEGSILSGETMELHPDHAFTRASGALLSHVIKLLAMYWHVFKGLKPTISSSTVNNILPGFTSGSTIPIVSAPIGGSSASPPTSNTQAKPKSIFGFRLAQTIASDEMESRLVIGNGDTRGYFANSPEYMQLYNSIRTSFESFKTSFYEASLKHRTIELLSATLNAFSRLVEVLRFAEVFAWAEEVLVYLETVFVWAPTAVLDAALNLLRALFGINLTSIWNTELAAQFRSILDHNVAAEAATDSLDVQIRRLCETHLETASQIRSSNAIGRSFLDWLHTARQSHQPAMLRPNSLPPNIQQPNLAYYIRLFEPLVLQCLHKYHLHTSSVVQAKILHILTALIELGINYSQLDEKALFLKTVIAQCESMQHSNATASYNHQTSSKDVAQLVSSMFQFFVALTYERRTSASSSTATSKAVLSLSQVVHLVEVLSAGGVDVDSFVVPALAPLIIDIYVRQGAQYQHALRVNALNSPHERLTDLNGQLMKELQDWNARRESLLRFLLSKFIHHSGTFDFLCVALEDASVTDALLKVSFQAEGGSIAYKTANEVCQCLLSSIADCSLAIGTYGEVEACLRLLRRLALPPWPSEVVHNDIFRRLISILFQQPQPSSFKPSLEHFQRWLACKFVSLRFLLLLTLKHPSALLLALREFGGCGELDPRAVLFEHLLDHLAITCTTLLQHLPDSMDDIFSDSSSATAPKTFFIFISQLLLAFQLDILTFNRLHCLSSVGIPQEKVRDLNVKLAVYGRLKPLALLLWHMIRSDVFHSLEMSDLKTVLFHRNSVCLRRIVFLLHFRSKRQNESISGLDACPSVDLLGLLKASDLCGRIASMKDGKQRMVFLKEVFSLLLTGIGDAKTPTEAFTLLAHLKKLIPELATLMIAYEGATQEILMSLIRSIETWLSPTYHNLLVKLPAIQWEIEHLLSACLREIGEWKVEDIPESMHTFLTSFESSTTIFLTRELPKDLAHFRHRSSRATSKGEASSSHKASQFVSSLIDITLQKSLQVSTKDAGRLAARLLQLKPAAKVPDVMPPRLLQHVIRQSFVNTMRRFNDDDTGAFETDPMWHVGKELLFRSLTHLSLQFDEKEHFSDLSYQRQLAGVTAATIDFLILSTRLPLPSAPSAEEIRAVSAFLRHIMQISIHLLNEIKLSQPYLFSLSLLTLRLSIVLSTTAGSAALNSTALPLKTLVEFAEVLDASASLSRSTTLMDFHPLVEDPNAASSTDDLVLRLRCLLVPRQPAVFRSTSSSYTLTRFTEVLNSFATNVGAANSRNVGCANDRSQIALASVMGLCRICPFGHPYVHALGMDSSNIAAQFEAFVIAICRRPEVIRRLRRLSTFNDLFIDNSTNADDSGVGENPSFRKWDSDHAIEMDRDSLAEASSWLLSLGWLDRSMFESTWTALLAVCTPPSSPLSVSSLELAEENPFVNSKEELAEENHCCVLGLNALTRLLLNAAHRPRPGDRLNSRPAHRPRLSMPPQFMHTRLGGRIGHVLSCLDQEARMWLYDIPPASKVIGCYVGNLGESMSWLSTNSDLLHPADLDSSANQVPIECLVKSMLRSSTELAGFEAGTILSCLQSLRLVHQAWLRPFQEYLRVQARGLPVVNGSVLTSTTVNTSQRKKVAQFFKRGIRSSSFSTSADSLSYVPLAFRDSLILTGILSVGDKTETDSTKEAEDCEDSVEAISETTAAPRQSALSLSVLTAVIKSAVLCSDLFATREQFLWLIGFLQAVYHSLPPIEDGFEAPIYVWLTTGLARCTAVLEATMLPTTSRAATTSESVEEGSEESTPAAPQQHHSAPILLTANLQAAVSVVVAAIGAKTAVPLQDAGLRAAMDLFQATLLLQATQHPALQQPVLLANPPTGSALLNLLLIQVCLYLDNRLENLFEAETTLQKRWLLAKNASSGSLRIGGSGGDGLSKLVRTSSTSPSTVGRTGANFDLNRAGTFKPRPPSDWAVERTAPHQCTVLATAFYIVEQFSQVMTTESTASIGQQIVQLTNHLIRLSATMLRDAPRVFAPPARLTEVFRSRFAATQSTLVCADSVVVSWTRGMQRLLLSGILRKEECEMLVRLAAHRLSSTNSTRLRLPALSLITTLLYVLNADFLSRASPNRSNDESSSTSSSDLPSADLALNTSMEYLTSLWRCLSGHGSPSDHALSIGPHICPLEARCISLSLSNFLQDLGKHVLAASVSNPSSSNAVGSVVNKALTEVARVDHGYVRLATLVLSAVVTTFSACKRGADVVGEWMLLALPSLLQPKTPRALLCHGYWMATVCVLLIAGATDFNHEAANSLLSITLASLPSPVWSRGDNGDDDDDGCNDEKRCLDLLLAALLLFLRSSSPSSTTEDGGRFEARLLEILRTAASAEPDAPRGGLSGVFKAIMGGGQ